MNFRKLLKQRLPSAIVCAEHEAALELIHRINNRIFPDDVSRLRLSVELPFDGQPFILLMYEENRITFSDWDDLLVHLNQLLSFVRSTRSHFCEIWLGKV